jgi:outer membrane protein assembly factor BamD (BamD/ComL family)
MKHAVFKALGLGAGVLFLLIFTLACASVPKEEDIPEELSVEELTLEAQNSFDKGNIRAAQVYYQTILRRFSSEPAVVMAAEYELSHIKIKQKKWNEALVMIDALLAQYEDDTFHQLHPSYRKLLEQDRKKIPKNVIEQETAGEEASREAGPAS